MERVEYARWSWLVPWTAAGVLTGATIGYLVSRSAVGSGLGAAAGGAAVAGIRTWMQVRQHGF